MPPQPVDVKRLLPGGKVQTRRDDLGGVFSPVPGAQTRPVYTYGPMGQGNVRTGVLFQCPESAIPDFVRDLLSLWWACRLVKALPETGGFLDQPLGVRQAFPIFEAMMQAVEQRQGSPDSAAAIAAATVARLFGGSADTATRR